MTSQESIEELARKRRQKEKNKKINLAEQYKKNAADNNVDPLLEVEEGKEYPADLMTSKFKVAAAEMQGRRPFMEDDKVIKVSYRNSIVDSKLSENSALSESFFAIYDGHGGPEASKMAAERLGDIFDAKLTSYFKWLNLLDNCEEQTTTSEDIDPSVELSKLVYRLNVWFREGDNLFDPITYAEELKKRDQALLSSVTETTSVVANSTEDISLKPPTQNIPNESQEGVKTKEEDTAATSTALVGSSSHEDIEFQKPKRSLFRRDSMIHCKNYTEDSYEPIRLELLTEDDAICCLLRESFLEMSEEMGKKGINNGTTAAVVYLRGNKIYTANVGDTRILRCTQDKDIVTQRLTVDHRANDESEHRRIREVGGFVAAGRVNGVVAVSRALGDNFLEPMVIADPYTTANTLDDKDDFIIIGCDGVFDYVQDEAAVNCVKGEKDPRVASVKLRNLAYDDGSLDNITCMVLKFQH